MAHVHKSGKYDYGYYFFWDWNLKPNIRNDWEIVGGAMQAQIENVIAYYYTVAQTLKRRIVEMEYEIGEIIPSEKQLAKEFSVSLITIKKALSILVREGLIVRKRGKGTQVIYKPKKRMPIKISSNFSDLFQWQSNYPTETKILDIGIVACSYRIRSIFGLNSDERILRLKRIRKLIS